MKWNTIKLNLSYRRIDADRMNQVDTKKLSSELLTNLDVTSCVYLLVKRAAKIGYDTITKKNQTYAYPVGTLAMNRQQMNMITTRYWMEYHPDDIVVVGGIAMALYDKVIQQSMSAYGIYSSPYVKNTADIDMVWYPRIMDTEPDRAYEVLTIRSPAMEEHVMRMEEAMKRVLQEKSIELDNIVYMIKNTIPYIESVQLTVGQSNAGLLAGTYKILIFCTLTYTDHTTITFELCDLSIHDGCSSQITRNDDGNLILAPMYDDPMYCSPFYQLITIHTPLYVGIRVPNMVSMIKQQLFAFQNLLHKSSDKCIIYYKRIRYLQMFIVSHHSHHMIQSSGLSKENIEMMQMTIDHMIQSIMISSCSNHRELYNRLLNLEKNRSYWHESFAKPLLEPFADSNKNTYRIPSTITYRIRRGHIVTIHLNDTLKASIENTEIAKYYHILSNITYDSTEYKRSAEQLNRIKRLIHDIRDNIHDNIHSTVEKRIIAESRLEPLQSLLQKDI